MSATVQCEFEMSGLLIEDAQARHRAIEGGPMVPVLCFALQTESATGAICRVQQLYPVGHERQCEIAASKMLKGMRVTFHAPSVGIELLARNASHVHLHQAEQAEAASA